MRNPPRGRLTSAAAGRTLPEGKMVDSLALLREWQRFLAGAGRTDTTRGHYLYWMLRFLVFSDAETIPQVTEDHVNRFLDDLGDRAPTKRLALRGLRSFFSWAEPRGKVPEDPTRLLRPKNPRRPKPVRLQDEELFRVLCAAWLKNERRYWALLLCFGLGTRRGELAHIAPDDVDWEGEQVLLRVTKGDQPRWVPMGPTARAALEGLRPWWNGTVLGGVRPSCVNAWYKQAARDAGVVGAKQRAHTLRKTYAKYLSRQGVAVEVISEILGHSSVAVTTIYLAVEEEEKREAGQLV